MLKAAKKGDASMFCECILIDHTTLSKASDMTSVVVSINRTQSSGFDAFGTVHRSPSKKIYL